MKIKIKLDSTSLTYDEEFNDNVFHFLNTIWTNHAYVESLEGVEPPGFEEHAGKKIGRVQNRLKASRVYTSLGKYDLYLVHSREDPNVFDLAAFDTLTSTDSEDWNYHEKKRYKKDITYTSVDMTTKLKVIFCIRCREDLITFPNKSKIQTVWIDNSWKNPDNAYKGILKDVFWNYLYTRNTNIASSIKHNDSGNRLWEKALNSNRAKNIYALVMKGYGSLEVEEVKPLKVSKRNLTGKTRTKGKEVPRPELAGYYSNKPGDVQNTRFFVSDTPLK